MITNSFTVMLRGDGCSLDELDRRATIVTQNESFIQLTWPSGNIGCINYRRSIMTFAISCCFSEPPSPRCDRSLCAIYGISAAVQWSILQNGKTFKMLRSLELEPDPDVDYPVYDYETEYSLPQVLQDCYGDVTFVVDMNDFIQYVVEEAPNLEYDDPC